MSQVSLQFKTGPDDREIWRAIPATLFSLPLEVAPDPVALRVSPRLREGFDVLAARLGGSREFLLAFARGKVTADPAAELVYALSGVDPRPAAVASPSLDGAAMRALREAGAAYLRDESNAWLPFLGIAAAPLPGAASPRPLSAQAQRAALNLVDGRWEGLSAGELAVAMGASPSAVSGWLAEIEAVEPSLVRTEWRRRVLANPGFSKSELLSLLEPRLSSPVRVRRFLSGPDCLGLLADAGALLSGEAALAVYAGLSTGAWALCLALPRAKLREVSAAAGGVWAEAASLEEAALVIEGWSCGVDGALPALGSPLGVGVVGALPLYARMAGEARRDPRLAPALARLREEACR